MARSAPRATPEEYGTRAVCLVSGCDARSRLITRTEHFDEDRQIAAFARILASPTVPVHFLECGHAVAYFTGP